jgi:hypothetical protein
VEGLRDNARRVVLAHVGEPDRSGAGAIDG